MNPRDHWMTPHWFCRMVHEVMGHIELDPMSSATANENVGATIYFDGIKDNAFQMSWAAGTLYFNPPYSVELFRPAVMLFLRELQSIEEAIVLTNAVHDTKAGAALVRQCDALCLPDRRIQFDAPPGVKKSTNRFNQMVTYFGPEPGQFGTVFSGIGSVFT